ncbi:MAG TPA: BTAD domain-containing putative transcriptional regulator, partial [Pseudonocardia sp.]
MTTVDVHLQLLGRFQARRGGEEVPPAAFGGRKVRTLLRVLAVRRPDLVPHDALADVLWPDRLPADPATNLGVLVNRARRALGDPATIVTGSGGYALGRCGVDVEEFLAALNRARAAADPATAARACATALAMWGEPLPEDTYADWARAARERLRRARAEVAVRAARAALSLGDPRAAAAHAADVVAGDPLDESAVLVLAEALTAAGDPAGALARIADLRRLLADQLGVDPSAEVEHLQMALLRGEVRPARRISVPAPAAPRPFAELAFVGRDDELGRLRSAVAAGGLVLLGGVAGSGKSRLVEELARNAALPVLAVRAFLPERAEAWGLARSVLREALAVDAAVADALPANARDALSVLLPELGGAPTSTLDAESRRALQHAGGLGLLEAAVADGVLLVVDDLQWADPSSLALIGSALARLPRLAAVLAYRPEELSQDTLDGLRGARGAVEIGLDPLSAAAVDALVADPELARAVLASTDGTPFAIAEVLRELAVRGVVAPGPDGRWTARVASAAEQAAALGRAGQREAIGRRAARQSGLPAQVLALLALLAREVPARTVAAASGSETGAVLEALAALAAAGLARLGEEGWATAHDLVAETVTAVLPDGERGRLHCLLARALEAEDADPSETARHHRAAGDLTAAARAWLRAAHQALAGHATAEA